MMDAFFSSVLRRSGLALALVGIAAAGIPAPAVVAQTARAELLGVLRISGTPELAPLLEEWRGEFARLHPGVRIVPHLKGTASAMYGLEMRTVDIAFMDRGVNPFERYGIYERSWTYPVEIEVATGSATGPRLAPAYAIYVHPKNPLRKLTIDQLDGIFGAERGGGWDKLAWNKGAARTAAGNVRTWGQLGVTGPLAGKAIHPYGPAIQGQGSVTGFQHMVLKGGATWNEEYREYDDAKRMFGAFAADPAGIVVAAVGDAPAGLVPLAIGRLAAGPFVAPTAASVADRSYPLSRPVHLYYTIDTPQGEPRAADPIVRAFVRYVLSAEGQATVARVGHYAPLPAALIAPQVAKLESDAWPAERPRP